jgi:hypothetical protein
MLKEEEHRKAVCAECGPVNHVSGLMRGGYVPFKLERAIAFYSNLIYEALTMLSIPRLTVFLAEPYFDKR